MPRDFRALLPARIRIPTQARGPGGTDALLGLSPLQSVPRTPWNRLPGSFLPAL
jgi:hypothetical protein